jgi:hypothetical protein
MRIGYVLMRVLLAILLAVAAPATKHNAADMTKANASVLAVKDLGKGWTGQASPQSGVTFSCPGYRPSGAGVVETGGASSPTFSYSQTGPFVLQKASVYATTAQADTYWQRAVTPKLLGCVLRTLEAVTARGVKVTITKKGTYPLKTGISHSLAFRVAGILETNGNRVTNYLDVIVLGSGRTITAITISSFRSPPPTDFELIVAHEVGQKIGAQTA